MIPKRRILGFEKFMEYARKYPTYTKRSTAVYKWSEKIVFEDRQQLEIPYDNKHPLHGKPAHVHIKDALNGMSIMDPKKYKSTKDAESEWNKAYSLMVELYRKGNLNWEDIVDNVYVGFVYKYLPNKDNEWVWNPDFLKDNNYTEDKSRDDRDDKVNDVVDLLKDMEDIKDALSKDGIKEYYDYLDGYLYDETQEAFNTITDSYDKDPGGLISVYRMVDYNKDKSRDLYNQITKNYKGVGRYWAWDEDAAEAHWGNRKSGTVKMTLYGKVAVDDINWNDTVRKNAGQLSGEKEIEIKNDGKVMIYAILDDATDKKIELESPVVVPVGSTYR